MFGTHKPGLTPRTIGGLLLPAALFALGGCGSGGVQAPTVNNGASPVVSLTATPTGPITLGQSVTLTWSTMSGGNETAQNCTASSGTTGDGWPQGSVPVNGSQLVTPSKAGADSYVLTCSGSGNTQATSSVIVQVNSPATAGAPTGTIHTGATVTEASGAGPYTTTVAPGGSFAIAWNIANTSGATPCTATGGGGDTSNSWQGALGASGSFPLTAGTNPGTFTYTLTCSGAGGTSASFSASEIVSSNPGASVTMNAFPANAQDPDPNPNADKISHINTNTQFQLQWTSNSATTGSPCTTSGGSTGDGWAGKTEPATGNIVLTSSSIAGSFSYVLSCSTPGGTSQAIVSLVVGNPTATPPTILSFSFSPTPPPNPSPSSTLLFSWTTDSTNTTACSGSGPAGSTWNGTQATSGNAVPVQAPSTSGVFQYALNCTGPAGSSSKTITVPVGNTSLPPSVSVKVAPTSQKPGQPIEIVWSSTGVPSTGTPCTAIGPTGSGFNGPEPSSNANLNSPFNAPTTLGTYSYTLSCTGPGGTGAATATLLVTNTPSPSVSIFAAPAVESDPAPGSSASTQLSWQTFNFNGASTLPCTAFSPGGVTIGNWTGNLPSAGNQTVSGLPSDAVSDFSISCQPTGNALAVSDTATVVVGSPGGPTISMCVVGAGSGTGNTGCAQAATVAPGAAGGALISWSTVNATACSASGSWSGSEPVAETAFQTGPLTAPDGTDVYTYTLNCTGPGGSASDSVTVTVTGPSPVDECGLQDPIYAGGIKGGSTLLTSPTYTAVAPASGSCLSGLGIACSVTSPGNVVDPSTAKVAALQTLGTAPLANANFATINIPVGVLATDGISVTPATTGGGPTFNAGLLAGFIVNDPKELLTLTLLQSVTVSGTFHGTTLSGNPVTLSPNNVGGLLGLPLGLNLDLLTLLGTNLPVFIGTVPAAPFDGVAIVDSNGVGVVDQFNVYAACVTNLPQ